MNFLTVLLIALIFNSCTHFWPVAEQVAETVAEDVIEAEITKETVSVATK